MELFELEGMLTGQGGARRYRFLIWVSGTPENIRIVQNIIFPNLYVFLFCIVHTGTTQFPEFPADRTYFQRWEKIHNYWTVVVQIHKSVASAYR